MTIPRPATSRKMRAGGTIAPPATKETATAADGNSPPPHISSDGAIPAPLSLAVLLSGSGRTLENLLRAIAEGELAARVVAVVSSRPDVRGLAIAAHAGLPAFIRRRRDYADDAAYGAAIYAVLAPYQPDLILLAGFLRRLVVPPQWRGRILNIHPALLPDSAAAGPGFYGERVHAAVLASGATLSGATVHVVDDGYDTGPVVLRTTVPILPDDSPASLGARVFAAECTLYPAAIRHYLALHPELFGPAREGVPAAVSGATDA